MPVIGKPQIMAMNVCVAPKSAADRSIRARPVVPSEQDVRFGAFEAFDLNSTVFNFLRRGFASLYNHRSSGAGSEQASR